jgi:hypothetical protein
MQGHLQLLKRLKPTVSTIPRYELDGLLTALDDWLSGVALHLSSCEVQLFNVHRILMQVGHLKYFVPLSVGHIVTLNLDAPCCAPLNNLCLLPT